jgi:D-alanyl-D-alanine-carboxypeptidase/D-alanyl-D-alanine-endopeptidase
MMTMQPCASLDCQNQDATTSRHAMNRRDYLLGSLGAGLALLGASKVHADDEWVIEALKRAVGARKSSAGMVAILIDESGTRMSSYGSSGRQDVAMDGDAVFEIMSNTKVLTSLLLADMEARGEVAFSDPVTQYLPSSLKLRERGGPITLLDLATYTSGLPNMPGNLSPMWWATAAPMKEYTQEKLLEFLAAFEPMHPPGTHYEYANLGFGLLGIALANRAGIPYEELLIKRVCTPLGMSHTRIALTDEMTRHLVQGHDLDMQPTELWTWPAMPGAGCVRSTANDLTRFVKASMGITRTGLRSSLAKLTQTQRPTTLPGTKAGMGWYITSTGDDQVVWKSGLSMGCNTFMGYSQRQRRGAVLLGNFLWQPLDAGTISLGVKLIEPSFQGSDFDALYPH